MSMRPFILFLSLLALLALTACGTEEELIPPTFLTTLVNDAAVTTTPFKDPSVIITVTLDDVNATLVANSTATGEVPVKVSDDGIWRFTFAPLTTGANIITFTASDKRGNLNQMILTVNHDPTPPSVTAVVQSVADPGNLQLIVAFDEALLESSLTTALFAVGQTPLSGATLDTLLTQKVVTLPLAEPFPPGTYLFTSTGVADLALPDGNSVAADYTFSFTIAQ
jgi:hypothetical protein